MANLISASEAARRLGVPQTTLSGWIRKGLVKGATKVSNMWLVPEDVSLDEIDTPDMGRPPKRGNGEKCDD